MNEVIKCIISRRSIRKYTDQPVSDDELKLILEAGGYAPSAVNQQGWHFTVVQNPEILAQITFDLQAFLQQGENPRFRKLASQEDFSPFHRASTLIIVSGDQKSVLPLSNCAAANQNMLLAAHSLGLGACWINIAIHLFSSERGLYWLDRLKIPKGYKPMCGIVVGYPAESPPAPPRKEAIITYIR